MMTPVYNVAIAYWRANSYSVNQYAARPDLSVFFTTFPLKKPVPLSRRTNLFTCCVHSVKQYSLQCFHFIYAETTRHIQRIQQRTKKNYLLPDISSKYDDARDNHIHSYYNSKVNSPSYFNLQKSGTDVLWQKVKFKLKLRKSENDKLRSYIKEQPADDITTATDEEK